MPDLETQLPPQWAVIGSEQIFARLKHGQPSEDKGLPLRLFPHMTSRVASDNRAYSLEGRVPSKLFYTPFQEWKRRKKKKKNVFCL
jgi:hypothetical protein